MRNIPEKIFLLKFAGFILRISPMFSQLKKHSKFRPVIVIYTLCVYALQYTFTAIIVLIGICVSYLKLKSINRFGHLIWAKSMFFFMGKRVHIEGKDNYDRSKKYILVANHASIYDIPAIMSVVPGVSWIGREYLVRILGFGRLLKMNDYIPIEPGQPGRSRQSIKQAIAHAKDGITVAIFPEGTRTLDGQLGTFKKGFIHILRATHLDILPVTLNRFYSLKPKTRFTIVSKGKLEIIIHPPIDNKKLLPMTDNEIIDVVKKTILSSYQGR